MLKLKPHYAEVRRQQDSWVIATKYTSVVLKALGLHQQIYERLPIGDTTVDVIMQTW